MRQKSILDLYITNRPSFVKSVTAVPNISDHEAATLADSNISAYVTKKKPRTHLLFSKADWPKIKEDILSLATSFTDEHKSRSVDGNWEIIKSTQSTKMSLQKHHHEKNDTHGSLVTCAKKF